MGWDTEMDWWMTPNEQEEIYKQSRQNAFNLLYGKEQWPYGMK